MPYQPGPRGPRGYAPYRQRGRGSGSRYQQPSAAAPGLSAGGGAGNYEFGATANSYSYGTQDHAAASQFSDRYSIPAAASSYPSEASLGRPRGEPQPLFGRERFEEERERSSSHFFQEPATPPLMQSSNQHSNQPYPLFHEPQPSNFQRAPLHPHETSFAYRGQREDPPSSPHDYRERLSSNPLRSQGASVWESFPQGGSLHREPVNTEPRPLMQNVIDRVTTGGRRFEGVQSTNPVPQTGLSSFDGGEVHGGNRFGDFSLDDSRMQEYSVPGAANTGPSGHWQNNSHRGVRRDRRGSGDFSHPSSTTWPHRQKAYPSSRGTSQPRLRGPSGENQGHYQDTLSRDHSLGPYGQASGRSLGQGGLLGYYSEPAGLGSMSGRSLLGSYSDLSNQDNLRPRSGDDRFQSSLSSQPMKRKANAGPRPQRGRRRGESSHGVRGGGSNQSSVTARDSWSEARLSGVGERMSRSRRHSSPVAVASRLKIKTELRDPDFERRPEESKTVNRDANQSWKEVSNSFGCSETFVKHEPSLEFGDLVRSARSPSPVSIQKRLGPHIPGSGSVQNRLGPPNEGIGVHSRLGPQENFSGSLPSDDVHSLLGLSEGLVPPLTSESVYSRLGPEENRGSLPSEGVHSRLGPEISTPGGPRVKTEPIFSSSPSDTLPNFYTDSPPLSSAIPMDLDNEEHGTQEPDLRVEIQGRQSLCAPSNLNLPSSVANSSPCFGNRPSSRSPHTESLPSDYPPVSHLHGDPSTGSRPQTSTPYLLGSTSSTSLTSSQQLLKLNLTSGELSVASGWRGSSSPLPEIGDLAQPPVSFDGGMRLGEERSRRFSLESGCGRASPLTSFEGCGQLGEESSGRFSHEFGSERSPLQESFSSRRDSLIYTAGNSKSEPTSFVRRPDLKVPLKHDSGVTDSGVSPRMRDLAKGSKSPSTVSPSRRSSNQSQLSSPLNPARSPLEESIALRSGVDARPFVATSSTRSQPPVIATKKIPEAGSRAPGKVQATRGKEQAAKSPTPTSVGQSIPVLLGKYSQSQPPVSTGFRIKDLPKPTKSPEKSKRSSSSSIKPNRTNTAFSRSTTPRKLATNRGKTAGAKKGKVKPTSKEKEKCSVNVVKGLDKRKEAASTGPSPRIRVEQRRSSAVELDQKECGYSVVSVTSVATLESELEEGELTDSDCEGLVIDLDQSCSSSSAPTPNKCRADKRRSSESRDVDGESDPQDQQETKAMGDVPKDYQGTKAMGDVPTDHQGTKAMGDVPTDHQGTKAMGDVPTDHQGTKAMGDVPKDHQGTKAMGDVPTDHQGTKAMGDVPKDHQETKTQSDASRTECETTLSDYNQSDPNVTKSFTSTTDIVEKPIKSEASSSEPAAPETQLTTTGRRSTSLNKRVRTAAVVVGLHLARKLDTVTCENSSSSVLLMLRSASSQLSQTLRFTFRQWKKPCINVDAALAYVQLRLPEVAAGRASVAKLAGLICMDSTTFFTSDLHTLFQHCEEDVGKWSVVSQKYYDEVSKQFTMSHLKTNFPKSVHKKTGESVTALVQQHVSKLTDVKGSTRRHFQETMPQPSFLDVARLKYGPPFMQVLDRIQKRFEEAAKKARSSDLFQPTSAVATTRARSSTDSTESGASPAQQLLSPSSLSNSTPVGSQSTCLSNSLAKLAQQSAPVSLFLHTHSASASHVETSVPIQPLLQTPVPIPSPSQPPIQPLFRPISLELQSGKPPVSDPSHCATPPTTTKVLPLFLTSARNSSTSSTADSSVHIPSSHSSFSAAPVLPITSSQLPKTTISPPLSQPVATTSPKNAVEARDEGAVTAAITNSQSVFTTQVADNRQLSSSLKQNTTVGVAPAIESRVATVEASEPSSEQSEPQQHVFTSETRVAKPEARVAATSNETLLHEVEVLHSEQRSENENIAAAAELKLKEPSQDAAGGTVREDGAPKAEVKLATENPVLSSETVEEEASVDASSKGVFETENLAAVSDNDSVSSGEIVSPTPSPPDRHDKLSKEGSLSYSQVSGAYSKEAYWHSSKGGKSDWRGHSDFNSPPRRPSLPRSYDYRRNRSPSPRNRRRDSRGIGERREWGRPRGGGRSYRERSIERRRRSRSKSWSGSPVLEKDRHSRRWSRDSFSPEERVSVRRRRTCNSLSPDSGPRKFGHAYEKWSQQQRDDGRRGEREGREKERKPTSDKSRDAHTTKDTRGPDSDEDLEVLELRKEAIMSMLKDPSKGDGKSVKDSEKEASCGKDENSESVGGTEEERQRPEEAVERNSSTSETETKEQRVKLKEATGESGTAVEEVPKEETVIEKAELQAPPDEVAIPTMAVTSSPEEEDIRSEMDTESKPGNDKGDNEVTPSKAASSEKSPDAKSSAKELLSVGKKSKEISSLSRPGAPKVTPRTSPACTLSPRPSSQPSPAPSSQPSPDPSSQPSPGPSSQPSPASVEPPSASTATTSITKPPPSPSNALSVPTAAGATSQATSQAASPKIGATKKMGTLSVKQTLMFKATSLPTSRSGSRVGSPASSRGSPAPLPALLAMEPGGSGLEMGSGSRRGSSISRTSSKVSTSVKIVPGSKVTWEIPEFHIQVEDSESEEEQTESETEPEATGSGGEGVKSAHRPPTMDEIDSVLGLFRRDAEAKARQKEPIVRSPSPLPSSRGEPLQSGPVMERFTVGNPEAVGMLPLEQQREYLELKKRLVLHAKRQREEAIAERGKGKMPLNYSTQPKKIKITKVGGKTGSEQAKPVEKQQNLPAAHEKDGGLKEKETVAEETAAVQRETVEREAAEWKKKIEEERKKRDELEHRQREEELENGRQKEEERKRREEVERRKIEELECRKREKSKRRERQRKVRRRQEMKVAELEGKIRSCRSQTELGSKELTSVTLRMAECESEMEEHELKIELLQRQLQLASDGRNRCRQQRAELQGKVRSAQENIGRHTRMIQETQRLLIKERDLLIAIETGHGDSTDTDMVSMEMDSVSSDGSKGEEDMEIVTSSGEETKKLPDNKTTVTEIESVRDFPTGFPALNYEAISDTEGPVSHSTPGTETESCLNLEPNSGVQTVSWNSRVPVRGKRRKLSRSQRTRKSSLSVSHTAVESVSDSEIDELGTRAGKVYKLRKSVKLSGRVTTPPIPTSPPPTPPPPPPTSPPRALSLSADSLNTTSTLTAEMVDAALESTICCPQSPSVASAVTSEHRERESTEERKMEREGGNVALMVESMSSEGERTETSEDQAKVENVPSSEVISSATSPSPPIEVALVTDTASESSLSASSLTTLGEGIKQNPHGQVDALPVESNVGGTEIAETVDTVPESTICLSPSPSVTAAVTSEHRERESTEERKMEREGGNVALMVESMSSEGERTAVESSEDQAKVENVPSSEVILSATSPSPPIEVALVTDTASESSLPASSLTTLGEGIKQDPHGQVEALPVESNEGGTEIAETVDTVPESTICLSPSPSVTAAVTSERREKYEEKEEDGEKVLETVGKGTAGECPEGHGEESKAVQDEGKVETVLRPELIFAATRPLPPIKLKIFTDTDTASDSGLSASNLTSLQEEVKQESYSQVEELSAENTESGTENVLSYASDSSCVQNPFISMLKISKVESLSNSPEASSLFSSIEEVDANQAYMTAFGGHMTFPLHNLMSNDSGEPSLQLAPVLCLPLLQTTSETARLSLQPFSSTSCDEQYDSPADVPTAASSSCAVQERVVEVKPDPSAEDTDERTRDSEESLMETSVTRTRDSESLMETSVTRTRDSEESLMETSVTESAEERLPVEEVGSPQRGVAVASAQDSCGSRQRRRVTSETQQTSTAVDEGDKGAVESKQRKGGKESLKKKQEGVVRKRIGSEGKVTKPTRNKRNVGSLPLTRVKSDSDIAMAVRKNKRKATAPRHYTPTTSPSSRSPSKLGSPSTRPPSELGSPSTRPPSKLGFSFSLDSPSNTLNEALHNTLQSALSPALASVLSPSSYCRLFADQLAGKGSGETDIALKESCSTACELQLNSTPGKDVWSDATSTPTTDSVTGKPVSRPTTAGNGQVATSPSPFAVFPSILPLHSCEETAPLSPGPLSPPPLSPHKSLRVDRLLTETLQHLTTGLIRSKSVQLNSTPHPETTSDESTSLPSALQQQQSEAQQSPINLAGSSPPAGAKSEVSVDVSEGAYFLSGPDIPEFGVLPRAVPNIPLEIKSDNVNVCTLRALVCARFSTSGSDTNEDVENSGVDVSTEERENEGIEVSENEGMETSQNESMEISQTTGVESTDFNAMQCSSVETSDSDGMETSLNEDIKSAPKPPPLTSARSPSKTSVSRATSSDSQLTSASVPKMSEPRPPASATASLPRASRHKPVVTSSKSPSKTAPSALPSLSRASASQSTAALLRTCRKMPKPASAIDTPAAIPSSSTGIAANSISAADAKSLSMENLLGKIQRVKANLVKQQNQATQIYGARSAQTGRQQPSQLSVFRVQAAAELAKKSGSYGKAQQAVKKGHSLPSALPQGQSTAGTKGEDKRGKVVPSTDGEQKTLPRSPRQKAGKLPVKAAASDGNRAEGMDAVERDESSQNSKQMDSFVKELGFAVTWKDLQDMLVPSTSGSFVPQKPSATRKKYLAPIAVGQPLLFRSSNASSAGSEVVMQSVVNLFEKQTSQSGSAPVSKGLNPHSHRYRPYSSPLLSLHSYRLSRHYRTLHKLRHSSLSHSNKIDPMKIMCKFDILGKCNDQKCGGQHFRDIALSKSELIEDLVAYAPSLSQGSPSNSPASGGKSATTAKRSKAGLEDRSGRALTYAENLIATFSGKVSDDQMFSLAAHKVSSNCEGRREGGFVGVEEKRRERDLASGGASSGDVSEAARPCPLYWVASGEDREEGKGHWTESAAILPDGPPPPVPTSNQQERSCKVDRYFATSPPPSSPTHPSPPHTPSDPAHFISLARALENRAKACEVLKRGLELHSDSEELWVECLHLKPTTQSVSDCHGDQDELPSRALSLCPTHAVVMKCIEVASSLSDKELWIKKGYQAITSQGQPPTSLSLCCVELLLSHTHLHCLSGRLDTAVASLKLALEANSDEASKTNTLFTGIAGHLSLPHLQLSYLTLLHLLYTACFPEQLLLSPHTAYPPIRLGHNVDSLLVPWSKSRNLSSAELQRIEQLLAVAITRCQYQDTTNSMETTFALYHNLILFQLTHRSPEIAQQTLNGLLNCSPHSPQLWKLTAQLQDWTTGSAMALNVLQSAVTNELTSGKAELYCYAAKLALSQVVNGRHSDRLAAGLPWLRSCVCQFYAISQPDQLKLPLPDITVLYRKLLGQTIPYDSSLPELVHPDRARKSIPHLWIAYCLLVRLTYYTLRGDYFHSSPEEAFESAVHSVNGTANLQIVWLEYLSYLRDKALRNRGSNSVFKAFSDCVDRCLVVMETKQATPTTVYGQPTHYHDFNFHEQVCEFYFSCLPPSSSSFLLSCLQSLVRRFPQNPYLIARLARHCLSYSHTSLDSTQAVLASILSKSPKCVHLWRLAIEVELAQRNVREARWMFREAVRQIPLSVDLWREFLLFELRELASSSSPPPSRALLLARDVVHRANQQGVVLTPHTLPSSQSPHHLSPSSQSHTHSANEVTHTHSHA